MLEKHYDRAAQDTGNVVNLGHVNVCINDQHLSTHYYVTGLGLTRDPYLNTGARNMWINVGMSQFHLPMGTPEQLRGVIGLVIPDREALLEAACARAQSAGRHQIRFPRKQRLRRDRLPVGQPHQRPHAGRSIDSAASSSACPMSASTSAPAPPTASRASIAKCCTRRPTCSRTAAGPEARVQVGEKQYLYFRETDAPEQPYDRHHVQIYIADFSGPHRRAQGTRPDHR